MNVFNFTTEELELTNKLQSIICNEIDHFNGSIPFSRYMELALYHQDLGYYNNLLFKFGKEGDFVTAPIMSGLFAKCLSEQISELFAHIRYCNILEIGAGDGQLMLDILSNMGGLIESYTILDLSANLVGLQQSRVNELFPEYIDKVKWINRLPDEFNGVIIGNEVLDAQPCEQYILDNMLLKKRNVTYADNLFSYTNKTVENADEILAVINNLPIADNNFIIDVNWNNRGFIKSIANCLGKGCAIFIDYGYGQDEYYSLKHRLGTVRGFLHQHKLDEVLTYPGLIDITSSIDFTAIALSGIANGLDLIDYTTQASFLLNCGILDYIKHSYGTERLMLSNQINQLTSPNAMGEVFKVIGFSKNINFSDWVGFRSFSQSHLL